MGVSKFRKAQLKIQQMAFMLIAITIFFALVGLFFISFKVNELKNQATNIEEKNAMMIATRVADSPEFSCGDSFGPGMTSCVDSDKIMMLKEGIEKYKGFWQVADIELRKIYPKLGGDKKCTMNNYHDCNVIEVYKNPSLNRIGDYSTFVSLCKKDSFEGVGYDKCEIAKLIIGYASRS